MLAPFHYKKMDISIFGVTHADIREPCSPCDTLEPNSEQLIDKKAKRKT
jgi:hypothetical protein